MKRRLALVLFSGFAPLLVHGVDPAWPQFRGPNASGVSMEARPPVHFGPGTNLAWKVEAPSGVSSPVVSGDRLFLTGFENGKLLTLAYDLSTGRELWRRVAPAEKIEGCHSFSSPAAPTPCTDGERVYAYFGSYGLLAYDLQGNEVWKRPLNWMPSNYGTATSPILAGGHLVLQHDGENTNAQLIALSPKNGAVRWESPRPLAGASYSTPMVWEHDGLQELIVQGKGRVAAYSLSGGPAKWWVRGWGFSAVTTPVAGDGMLFVGGSGMGDPTDTPDPIMSWSTLIAHDTNKDGKLALAEVPDTLIWHIRKEVSKEAPGNSFKMRSMLEWFVDENKDGVVTKAEWDASEAFANDKFNADRFVGVRPGAKEDSTESHVVWETTRGLSENPSPLFYRGRVCFIRDGAMWTVVEPKTGKRLLDRERIGIGGQVIASPVAADGRVYIVNEPGTVAVLQAGDKLEVLATVALGENVRSTPALVGGKFIVRTAGHLWAFEEMRR